MFGIHAWLIYAQYPMTMTTHQVDHHTGTESRSVISATTYAAICQRLDPKMRRANDMHGVKRATKGQKASREVLLACAAVVVAIQVDINGIREIAAELLRFFLR